MILTKWTTNSPEFKNDCDLFKNSSSKTKVLGINWDTDFIYLFIGCITNVHTL